MSSFTVTTQASQAFQGNQDEVSLVNNGANTIYIDNVPGVSPLNGFPLPPTAQMTWKAGQPLWIVTALGQSVLTATPVGNLSLTARGDFWLQLLDDTVIQQFVNQVATVTRIETGFCTSLILNIFYQGVSAIGVNFPIVINWLDATGNVISTDTYNHAILSVSSLQTGQINTVFKVKGVYADISIGPIPTAGFSSVQRVIIYGTSRLLPFQSFTPGVVLGGATGGVALLPAIDGGVFDRFNAPQALNIPQLGNHIQIQCRYQVAVTTAGILFLAANGTNAMLAQVSIPVLGAGAVYTIDCDVPTGTPVLLFWSPAPVTAQPIDLIWTWSTV